MKNRLLVFFWRKIGRLKILFRGNQSATLRFTPSVSAVKDGIASVEGRSQGKEKGEGKT